MSLTREFKETVMERVQNDPAFGEALLQQGVQAMLDGEIEVGKSMLRDVINATIGFETLGRE
ncbi:MAG: transcriptional regulator, partial [Sulfitobacter sp.]